ncbi:MAG: amidohydrolase [Candidatus Hodarchaeales archaeon]
MKAIVNGTIWCPKQGIIENGVVIFDKGKITDVGSKDEIKMPSNSEIIEADDKFIVPGFIDAHSHQGLFDGSIGWAGMDGNEMTDPVTPHMRGLDSFNPNELSIKREVLRGGVTCINTGPGSGNVISGQALVIKPVGKVIDEMIVKAPSGLKIALGENPKRIHGQINKRTPSTRMGIAALLRKTFVDAENYIQEQESYKIRKDKALENNKAPPPPPKRDLKMEIMVKVLRKEIPLHAHCHRSDDIATIIRIAEEFDVDLVIIHGTDSAVIADYIAKKDIPVVYGPTILWVSKQETINRSFKTPVILNKAGVKVALQTDSLTPMLYFHLLPMFVIKEGMSREDALKCVTSNPAEILGIEDRVGSLEVGKDADIVIWSDDPFKFYSQVEKVFVNGEEVELNNS